MPTAATSSSRTRPTGPTRSAVIQVRHVREQNECIFIWNDALGRDPLFDIPDIFGGMYDENSTADDYYPRVP